jgi:hypothetical protein
MCKEAIDRALEEASGPRPEVWLYRGAWQEWPVTEATWLVPLSQEELQLKIQAIFKHQSQKDSAPFPGLDEREFWQRVEARNKETAAILDRLGLAEYFAMEAYVERVEEQRVKIAFASTLHSDLPDHRSLGFACSAFGSTIVSSPPHRSPDLLRFTVPGRVKVRRSCRRPVSGGPSVVSSATCFFSPSVKVRVLQRDFTSSGFTPRTGDDQASFLEHVHRRQPRRPASSRPTAPQVGQPVHRFCSAITSLVVGRRVVTVQWVLLLDMVG